MTAPMRNMLKTMDIVINSFEQMQSVSRTAVDTSAVQQARQSLNQVADSIDKAEDNIRQATNGQRNFNNELRNGGGAASGLAGKIMGVVAAYASLRGLKAVLNLSDTVATTKARLDLMNDGLQSTKELQDKIFAAAQRSRGAYQSTADMVSKLGILAKDAFSNNDETIEFAEQLNKQFTICGTSAVGMEAATLQMTQAMGTGVLRGEDLRSIFQQVPTVIQSIADYMGLPIGKIKELADQGALTADVVKNAMFAAADDTNAKFASMPKTFSQIWTSFKNQALMAFQPILEKLNTIANSPQFQQFVDNATTFIQKLGDIALQVFDAIMSITNFISSNWNVVGPIVWGIVAAVTAWTIAQWLLNLAMLASPLGWVCIAIAAVVAAIAIFINWCGGLRAAWLTMCNWILIAWDWVKIGVMIGVYYIIDCWNNLVKNTMWVGMQVQNLLGDMKVGVLKIIESMCNGAIDIINAFIAALNWIPGVSIEYIQEKNFGAEAAVDNEAAKQARQADYDKYEQSLITGMDARWNQIDQWKSDALSAQQQREAAIAAAKAEANKKVKDPAKDIKDQAIKIPAAPFEGINNNTADTAKNTKDIKDSMDITSEDLKYLRDLAEQEVINRFTTASLSIDVTNHNTITSDMDIDGIVDQLNNKVQEALVSTAEGVH